MDVFYAQNSIRIGVIYRPPGSDNISVELLEYMQLISQTSLPLAIFGDFNFPGINWESFEASTSLGQDIFFKQSD